MKAYGKFPLEIFMLNAINKSFNFRNPSMRAFGGTTGKIIIGYSKALVKKEIKNRFFSYLCFIFNHVSCFYFTLYFNQEAYNNTFAHFFHASTWLIYDYQWCSWNFGSNLGLSGNLEPRTSNNLNLETDLSN